MRRSIFETYLISHSIVLYLPTAPPGTHLAFVYWVTLNVCGCVCGTTFLSGGRYQGNTYTLDHRQTSNDLVMREALEKIAQQPAVPVGLFFSSGVAAGSMRCVSCAYACIIIVDRDRSDLGAKDRDDSIIMRSTVKAGRSQGQ